MSDNIESSNHEARIAFLGYMEFDNAAAYRGGILVTDGWGKPLEFRCTAPVKPNAVQRTLYGRTLMPHILVELIAVPLLQAVQQKPEVVVVQESMFFDLRYKTETPVVRLRRQGSEVKVRGDNEGEEPKPVVVASQSGKFDPVVMEPHWQFAGDIESCHERMHELFGRWDLIEPFDRLTKGLDYIHGQKELAG